MKNEERRADGYIIYQPKGRAGEYSQWAANIFNGCSNQCSYCYNRQGYMAKVLGLDHPVLKKTVEDAARAFMKRNGGTSLEDAVVDVFTAELVRWHRRISAEGGLMMSFSTDPMLEEELPLTMRCLEVCVRMGVPVSVLTKCTAWLESDEWKRVKALPEATRYIAVGFTLTGMDEMESGAPSNAVRIGAMKSVRREWFRTFASVEPVIDVARALGVIRDTIHDCCHYKVGLRRGKNDYDAEELRAFVKAMNTEAAAHGRTVYWKDSVKGMLPDGEYDAQCCVAEDYNIFLND